MSGYQVVKRQPCAKQDFLQEQVGADCPACGHTNLVHTIPGRTQTAGQACQLCVLEIKVDQLDELIGTYQASLDKAMGKVNEQT